jgi:uncharacterized coiled-coil protein SlyX
MAKPTKRTHEQRIRMLENSILNLHDNVLPAMNNAIAERDSVIHACVLQLRNLDPTRKLVKIAGPEGHFWMFATEEEADAAAAPAPAVDTEENADNTAG